MTEREKLFLYHGVCIGASGGKGPERVVPLMNELAAHDQELCHAVMDEVKEEIEAAERRLAAKN